MFLVFRKVSPMNSTIYYSIDRLEGKRSKICIVSTGERMYRGFGSREKVPCQTRVKQPRCIALYLILATWI